MRKNCIITLGIMAFFAGLLCVSACNHSSSATEKNYRQEMRQLVQEISFYAKQINPDFVIIPQNGVELVSISGDDNGPVDMDYMAAIDGIGQESLNYGYAQDDEETPESENRWIRNFLDMARNNSGIKILVTDYCSDQAKMARSYALNNTNQYISFAADHRALDAIPDYPVPVFNETAKNISNLQQAQNFLYLINPDNAYSTRQDFVDAITHTNYDLIIMDYFYNGQAFTHDQIEALKQKANGGRRLLICYLSIGEAEDYRYYWQADWTIGHPHFVVDENPNWAGNYVVKYWDTGWKDILFGNYNSYLKKIIDAGFDGVYLDIIDAFEYFEDEYTAAN
ncbi:MAG: hypothetical protein CSA29_05685 [Desulfobacterales bacterium]|nr:MAG: hypothetical protein CSA29_05685 [Desulfobacterales bacterium]